MKKAYFILLLSAICSFDQVKSGYPNFNVTDEECEEVCHGSGHAPYQGVVISTNQTSRILTFANFTEPTLAAVAIDLHNDIFLMYNGTSGDAFVFDVKNKRQVLITPEQSPLTWKLDAYTNPTAYFLRIIPNLKVYFDIPFTKIYSFKDIPADTLRRAAYIGHFLIGEKVPGIDTDRYAGTKYGVTGTHEIIVELINGPLRGILPFLDGKKIYGNVGDWIRIIVLLGNIFKDEFANK